MRILHISTRLIIGGSQENTVLSCEGQATRAHDVHLAFGPIYGPEGSMLPRVQAYRSPAGAAITTHEVPNLVRQLSPTQDPRAYRRLAKLIRDLDPDIVHTHSSKAGILGRLAAWRNGGRKGRPGVVHTIHGPPFHAHEKPWRNALYIQSERIAAKHCHAIVSVADAMTNQFLSKNIGRKDQYTTVRSGMDTRAFLDPAPGQTRDDVRARLGLDESHFVVGTVARLAELKGHDDILTALEQDMRENPHWRLLWVGDGWWRDRLLARVRDMGLESRVITTGLVEPAAVPGLMRAMDLLAHPSYREGLPRTLPQALLCATPVVAYDADGAREVCLDKSTGRLVEPGNIEALRESILWMAADESRRSETAHAGREMCREMFDADRMVDELEKVYADALGA